MTPMRAEMTPATRQFTAAVEAAEWARALEILDEHWVEIWFAVDPTDLRNVVAQAPPEALAVLSSANYVARATGFGPVEDLVEPQAVPARDASPAQLVQFIADLRLRGRPVLAMTHVRRHEALIHAQRGRPVDGSGGRTAMWLVQAGITALLAGEPAVAKGMLLTAIDTHRPDRFPFVVREATAKLALAHAVGGDVTEAMAVNEQARRQSRTRSWVETMVDDTVWLTDYICAVDTLQPRAEEMRRARPSPMVHREFWPVALAAQVRHLVLTRRTDQAEALCEAVAAAGLPPADADGVFATAVEDGRRAASRRRPVVVPVDGRNSRLSAQAALSRALHLLTTGQYASALGVAQPATTDVRLVRAMSVVKAQAMIAEGRVDEGRHLLLATLGEALSHRTYGTLSYLTRETLEAISDTAVGAEAARLVRRHDLPMTEIRPALTAPLTDAELDVLRLLDRGLTRQEMAERLFLSVNTVKTQLSSAYRKLGVTTRTEALAALARLEL